MANGDMPPRHTKPDTPPLSSDQILPLNSRETRKRLFLLPEVSVERKMTFTNYIPCGGPSYDQVEGDWSRFFVVNDKGEIQERENELSGLNPEQSEINAVSSLL